MLQTVQPFGETVQQVFARVSALRDSLDGPQLDDQGLINEDPRFIYVPNQAINMIPTDVRCSVLFCMQKQTLVTSTCITTSYLPLPAGASHFLAPLSRQAAFSKMRSWMQCISSG